MGMTSKARVAYLALPVETRRQLLRCGDAFEAFRVLDRTDLPEDVKCEIGGTFPITSPATGAAAREEERG